MSKMLWELKAPLVIAKAKEDMGLNNIFKYMRYYRMFLERFKWIYKDSNGIKHDLTNRIENKLFWRGKVALYKDAVYGLVVAEIDKEVTNPNGEIVSVDISAENGYKCKNKKVGEEVVILYSDETRFAPVLYIWAIANQIIEREDIINQQDNMLRKPIVVTGQGAELDEAMTKMANVLSGVEWFNLNPKSKKDGNIMLDKGLEVLNLQVGNAYKGMEVWQSRGKYEELLKDYLGYSSVNNEKRERMIQAEVTQSASVCDTFYKSSRKLREDCREDVKSVLKEDLELQLILEEEKEVEENGNQENKMGRTNAEDSTD